jgi:glycine/serine hydroxymethyltransferase
MDEPEMKEVASIIGEVLRNAEPAVLAKARDRVAELMARFPVYA